MDKLLTQFLAVADSGTLSGAATALRLTQPTLTLNMRKLEETVGAPLFERSSRGVRLTRYGETLYENARLMHRLYDNTLAAIADQQRSTERGLSIGSGYSWWTLFLRDMLVQYQEEFPRSPVQVSLGDQLRLLDQLLSSDISLFIAHEMDALHSAAGTDFIPITRVFNAYFVRQDHPLAKGARSQAEIDAFPLVTTSPPDTRYARFFDPTRRQVRTDHLFGRGKFAFSSNSLAACVDYTLSTLGVLTHSHVMEDNFRERGLVPVTQKRQPRTNLVGIHVLRERRGEERIEDLITRIRTIAAERLPSPGVEEEDLA